jgi:lipid-A-disaccharide synthase
MGITEVIRHAPKVYGSYRSLVASIRRERPAVGVLIDFPDVNLRLARELKALGIPVVYFVSPQLWAWKRRRLRWVQERVDRMMVIFPFEETFYRSRHVNATYTGHPLAELPHPQSERGEFAARYGLNPAKRWVALLPGSRGKELRLNLPTMLDAAAALGDEYEFLLPVASTLKPELVQEQLTRWHSLHQDQPSRSLPLRLIEDAREALFHARASIVASGTATVQAAVVGNPFVVVYKVSPLTFSIAKRLVSYPPEIWSDGPDGDGNLPIGMVNLIAGRRIVPELIQQNFTPQKVLSSLRPLLDESMERSRMIDDLAELRRRLGSPLGTISIRAVADAIDRLTLAGLQKEA